MSADERWRRLDSIVGEWRVGQWRGEEPQAQGGFTLERLLGGRAFLRRNVARLPQLAHEDVILIYRDGEAARALYVDIQDHVIAYRIAPWKDGFELVSEGETRYRMRHTPIDEHRALITFEIAPPGGGFAEHVAGEVTRVGRA